jgi:hypothetical protein
VAIMARLDSNSPRFPIVQVGHSTLVEIEAELWRAVGQSPALPHVSSR